nr:unnamed protein product [Callosobruchus chinensis]
MSFRIHIDHVCGNLNRAFHAIFQLKSCLSQGALMTIYYAAVHSHLSYHFLGPILRIYSCFYSSEENSAHYIQPIMKAAERYLKIKNSNLGINFYIKMCLLCEKNV